MLGRAGAGIPFLGGCIDVLINAFTMTSDEKMPDGNLVVAVPSGMESIHHYVEPVGWFFRRDFSFDEERTADSLSKIYGVDFRPLRKENEQWVYGSDACPGVEVTNIIYGFTATSDLDNDFELMLIGKMLKEHQEVFASHGVELVPYLYGPSEWNPKGKGDSVDGSIFPVTDTKEAGKYQSIRNIPFGLSPEYTWIYDASVTASEIVEEIVIQHEIDDEKAEEDGRAR